MGPFSLSITDKCILNLQPTHCAVRLNGPPGGSTLTELGLIGEYVEDLPYRSEVLGLSLDDWEAWPAERQLDFVHRLESKVQYYHALHDPTDLWVSLNGGPITGESVFPLLLELLP